jgi:hypothetical protein
MTIAHGEPDRIALALIIPHIKRATFMLRAFHLHSQLIAIALDDPFGERLSVEVYSRYTGGQPSDFQAPLLALAFK